MAKITQEKKLEALKGWLSENGIPFIENHESGFGVTMDVKIPNLMIAVFVSDGDRERETALYSARTKEHFPLYRKYKPFFIRPTDTKAFVLEKLTNCCRDRMIWLQQKYLREMDQQRKEGKE